MQGTSTRPTGPAPRVRTYLGPEFSRVSPHERPTSDLRWRWRGRKCWDTLPGVTSGKSATGFRFSLPRGPRLLEGCLGTEMAASQETSCTSASNSPWEEKGNGRGLHWGRRRKGKRGGSRGGSEQAAAGLSPRRRSFLQGWLTTCPPGSRACPPPSERPGTASGPPGCS